MALKTSKSTFSKRMFKGSEIRSSHFQFGFSNTQYASTYKSHFDEKPIKQTKSSKIGSSLVLGRSKSVFKSTTQSIHTPKKKTFEDDKRRIEKNKHSVYLGSLDVDYQTSYSKLNTSLDQFEKNLQVRTTEQNSSIVFGNN